MYHKQIEKIITKEIYKKKNYDEIINLSKYYINVHFKEDLPISFCFFIICFLFIFLMYIYGEEKIQFIYSEALYERYYDIKNIDSKFYVVSFIYVNTNMRKMYGSLLSDTYFFVLLFLTLLSVQKR